MTVTNIVVGVDGSSPAEDALVWALREGRLRSLPVRAVHVWHEDGAAALPSVAELRERLEHDVTAGVRAVAERAGATDVPVTVEIRHGHPAQELIQAAGAGTLLVVGSRGRGTVAGSLLGSVGQSSAQYAQGPVVVVRGPRRDNPAGRVVVGVDGSAPSAPALRFARDTAVARGAVLQVVHTWTVPYMGFAGPVAWPQEAIDDVAAQASQVLLDSLRGAGIDDARAGVELSLVQGPPAATLLEIADGADLLVVGSRGYGGWKGLLLGSVSTRAVTQAPLPVAVIRD
ncbi:universal stress protein [Paractinoplanes rishiriensis]|uniref:Universal stress protein n=1 Tax=Paractinoplanes rishiriensis TaxID=1050105 RepID=A0A919K7G9_9ACTN|nr:universal stress protein [Actinoplanes rishiriensis]GIF01055.1 universal stress protein [Actinoplanes rishiriensis]